ncbi:MAG TPA: DUF1801 domain-containing protein [Kofleriaceae bacterium]
MTNVDEYLAKLPDDRRTAIAKVRDVINANLPVGYEEKIQFGMISWCVPESALPAKDVYNKQPLCLASLASQKNHMAVYMMHIYGSQTLRTWFESAYRRSGKKLDMGQSCVRFKTLDALPLEVIGEAMAKVTVDNYVAGYRNIRDAMKKGSSKPAAKKAAAKTSKRSAAKKPAAKKPAAKKAAKKTAAKKPAKRS